MFNYLFYVIQYLALLLVLI